MEILILLLRICLVSSFLVAASSSGLDLLSPLASPPSPLPETSRGFGQVPIISPESHKSGNAPPPKAFQPSLPPLADVAAPPPSDSLGGKAPAGEPIVPVHNAPAPATIPVKDLPGNSPPVQPITPTASPPQFIPGSVTPSPVSSPVSDIPPIPSVALPPPTPSSVPPRNDSNNHKPPIEKPTVSSPVSDIPPFPSVALPPPTPSSVPPRNDSNNHKPPIEKPIAPVASPPTISIDISPTVHPVIPKLTPSSSPVPTLPPTKGSPRRTKILRKTITQESNTRRFKHYALFNIE